MSTDLLPVLVGFGLRSAVLLALAWLLTSGMRRAAAATRHSVWTCAVAAAVLLPLIALVAPRWQVISPAPEATTPRAVAAAPLDDAEWLDSSGTDQPPPRVSDVPLALIVWSIGTGAVLAYVGVGMLAVWRLRRSAVVCDTRISDAARLLARASGIWQPITVAESSLVTTPIVCGLWRPLIVMPTQAVDWPSDRLDAALRHELAHVRRGDCLTQALAHVVCAAYWFNPLAWIAARQLRTEREKACDDVVLSAGVKGSDYANHLLEIAVTAHGLRFGMLAASGVAMARRSQLEGRLAAILDPSVRRTSSVRTRVVTASLVIAVSIPVAAVELTSRPQVVTVPASEGVVARGQVEAGLGVLTSSNAAQRAAAACALATAGDRAAISSLIALMDDGEPLPRQRFCGTEPPFEDESWAPEYPDVFEPSPGEAATRALLAFGDAAVEPLTETLLRAPHWRARKNAAWALAHRGRAVDALMTALNDPAWQVRAEAAYALFQRGGSSRQVIDALASALFDADWRVREQATLALGHKGGADRDVVESLMLALRDAHPRVRASATAGLWHTADARAWDALFGALTDPDEQVRAGAARALGNRARDPEVQRLLASQHDPDSRIRDGVREALRIVDQRMRGTTTTLTRITIAID